MSSIQLGSVTIYTYGLALALACAAALLWMSLSARKNAIPARAVSTFAVIALPLGVLCSRAGWCLARLDWVSQQEHFFFQFQRGGGMLYGALLGVLLALWVTARIQKLPFARLADLTAAPGLLVIAIGRLAEGLVGEGYGRNVYEWFDPWGEQSLIAWEDPSPLFRFPFAVPDHYEEYNFAIFVLEAFAAILMLVLVLCSRRRKAGAKAVLALLLYASMQAVFESMRQDSVLRFGFVRVNQLLSGVLVLILLIICMRGAGKLKPVQRTMPFVELIVCCGIIMAMEFALEKKIDFLTWMRMDVCYMVMALGALGLIFTVLPLWRKAFPTIKES